jgi:ABC-type multidrug transport system fused ATPase/permease subunit
MIPQAGFLFEASVRDNLDPFNLVKREKVQSILKMGKDIVAKSLKDSKSTSSTSKIFNEELMIERGGKNLSLGEKQILNILRVLLRDNQLILLDEATSNIDPITGKAIFMTLMIDQIIHELLFEICKEKTLVAVTHKLEYLPRYDKVILVEDGKIVEIGSYASLMSQSYSKLKSFISEN